MTREIAGDCKWPPGAQEGGVSSVQNHWKILSVLEYFLITLIEFRYNKVHYKVHSTHVTREIAGDCKWLPGAQEGGVPGVQNHWKILSVLEYFLITLIEFRYNKVHYKVHSTHVTREIAGDCKWLPGAQKGGVSGVQNHWKILSVLEYFLIALIEFRYNKSHHQVHSTHVTRELN